LLAQAADVGLLHLAPHEFQTLRIQRLQPKKLTDGFSANLLLGKPGVGGQQVQGDLVVARDAKINLLPSWTCLDLLDKRRLIV
jgi:hypothetical protein